MNTAVSDSVIDVSHYQGEVDFKSVKAAGIEAVFIKATQGVTSDPLWPHNRHWAGSAGLLFAPYHFVTGDAPQDQFAVIMRVAAPAKGGVVMLDWEPNPHGRNADPDLVAVLGQLCQTALGRAPLLYCGRWQLRQPHSVLNTWPLALPEYGDRPICPPGWPRWLFHQYDDDGRVDGIAGAVDRSRFAGSPSELIEWWSDGRLPQDHPALTPPIPQTGTLVTA